MTTLTDRDRTALLVIDVQQGVVAQAWHRNAVVGRIADLVPADGEPRVDKQWGDAFAETDLEPVLADLGASHLVLCGAQTDFCIVAILYGAVQRGYDLTLVEDAHTTDDTEFGGHALSAEFLTAQLNRTAASASLPGITLTASPAAAITW